jgi:hypothetical protein
VPFQGNFSEYWHAHRPSPARERARVATRGRQRERVPAAAAPEPRRIASDLDARIEAAEREMVELERRVAAAFTQGDHREGTRASALLEQHRARLDELYERWAKEEA